MDKNNIDAIGFHFKQSEKKEGHIYLELKHPIKSYTLPFKKNNDGTYSNKYEKNCKDLEHYFELLKEKVYKTIISESEDIFGLKIDDEDQRLYNNIQFLKRESENKYKITNFDFEDVMPEKNVIITFSIKGLVMKKDCIYFDYDLFLPIYIK